jgi:hypothetical protein
MSADNETHVPLVGRSGIQPEGRVVTIPVMPQGWRDVPQPPSVRRLPKTTSGIPVSYTVMWSSETTPVKRVDPLLTAIGCALPALFHSGRQGEGEPVLSLSSVERQRRVAILGLCQVCGQKLTGRQRWLADLRNHDQEMKIGFRRVPLIVDGWTCDPCLRYSFQICPGLAERRPRLLRVRDFELIATVSLVEALPDEPLVEWVKIAPTAFDWVSREDFEAMAA